ncbi:MAG TPA: helix-turn-helix domain-containing protein [Candidatus Eremiobacteraeota bacterium]|nr:MAG: HTH-type transcriptional repressor RghR [bacterium ADurb.Bin363]HPZ06580.1 helix-turn-helix domain-containing protein [Candidatus Eremiobacteraeota bacterium]
MDFRTYLRDLIARHQMTLSQIEMRSNIPSTYMSQVLSGKRMPNEITLRKLSKILSVSEEEMLERAGKAQITPEEEFRRYLRELIDKNQLTLTQVEIKSGISNSYLSQILSGKRGIPPEETLRKLARSLEINEFEMLEKAGKLPSDFQQQVQQYLKTSQPVMDEGKKISEKNFETSILGDKVQKARLERGYTITDLAMEMCYSEELLRKIEGGKHYPGNEALFTLSKTLGKPLDYFKGDRIEINPTSIKEDDYLEEKFEKLQEKLDRIYKSINIPHTSDQNKNMKRLPIFPLSVKAGEDFFYDGRIEGYVYLPGDFFQDIEVVVLVEQSDIEPVVIKCDRLLIKKKDTLEIEGQLCLFYDAKEKNCLVRHIFSGLEGKLMAGLNRKEAIFNFYEERHREITILGIVRYLIRDLEMMKSDKV